MIGSIAKLFRKCCSADDGATKIVFRPVGIVRSPFQQEGGTPIQPTFAKGARGTVVVCAEYQKALTDLDGFTHIWLLYHLDRAKPWKPLVVPYRDTREHGLFATRSPSRPNGIGMSVVRLISVKGNELEIEGVDILDNTPLIDIKPYVAAFDAVPNTRAGWFDDNVVDRRTADDRFSEK